MSNVFISYENEDRDFAEALIHRLKNLGISVWEQPSIAHLSEERYAVIEQALRNASVFVVIMTPTVAASESVTYEWIFALGVGVPIISIILKDTTLHPRLAKLSRFDFTNYTTRPWDDLLEAVQKVITAVEPHRILPSGIPSYIQEAIKALDSANPDDREGAIDNLTQADHPIAVEALIGAMSHPLQDVRIFAALARGEKGDARAVPELLNALDQADEGISNNAIIALGTIGDITAIPYLIHTLYRRWGHSRYLITDAIEKMGDTTVPVLQNILHEENVERKTWAIQTLKGIGDAAVPSLIQALCDKERAVKVYAIGALSDIGGSTAVSSLIDLLASDSEEWSIRNNAVEALGKMGDARAIPSLVQALSYNNDDVRRVAAKALRQIGNGAVPGLIEILGTAKGDVRRRIHTLLKQIGTPEALSAINIKAHHQKRKEWFLVQGAKTNNISTFRAMLERRGYTDFFFSVKRDEIECTVCGPRVEKVVSFAQQEWDAMTVEDARIYLNETIGEGMIHVMHVCGQGLLLADEGWNAEYSREIPFSDLPPGYYAVPVDEGSEPIEQCMGCGLALSLGRRLPRVDDPQELIPEDDDFDDLAPRDLEFIAGDLALHEKDFLSAEDHFRTTLDLDDLCSTDARQYLGLTLVWQGKLEEATEHFELDMEDRGVRLSGFFALWCVLCSYEDPQAFITDTKKYYTQLGWLDEDGNPIDDDWDERDEQELHAPLLPRDTLSLLKENFEADSIEDIATPGDRLLSALVSYLRQDFQRVLALLYSNDGGTFGWAVAFWMVLACLELGREADAYKFLEQIKPGVHLPPALLAPLRWTQTRVELH